jgi:CRP/FNR family transcriptional regulator, cyclic AMP receptor protein
MLERSSPANQTPAVIARNRWFASLSPESRNRLWGATRAIHFSDGQSVFAQGDRVSRAFSDGFFVLVSGQLKVGSVTASGREAVLTLVAPGSWFGELSLIDGQERPRTVTCVGDCELRVVPQIKFAHLLDEDPAFAGRVTELVAARTRLLLGLLEDNALRSTRARIARRLVLLAHGDDVRSTQAQTELGISQESLALMLGLTRPSISRQLKSLSETGAITQRYGRILIDSMMVLLSEAAAA